MLCVFYGHDSLAQTKNKHIYFEFLGASNGIGVNYDARFNKNATDGFGWRTGVGFGYSYSSNFLAVNIADDKVDSYNHMFRFSVPVEVNYLLGKGNSKFETGAGLLFCLDRYTSDSGAKPENSFGLGPYLGLGYRLVTKKGFLFRAGALPSYDLGSKKFGLWPYLGFGWSF